MNVQSRKLLIAVLAVISIWTDAVEVYAVEPFTLVTMGGGAELRSGFLDGGGAGVVASEEPVIILDHAFEPVPVKGRAARKIDAFIDNGQWVIEDGTPLNGDGSTDPEDKLTISLLDGPQTGQIQLKTEGSYKSLDDAVGNEITFSTKLTGDASSDDVFKVDFTTDLTDKSPRVRITGELTEIDTYNFVAGTVVLETGITDAATINVSQGSILDVSGAGAISVGNKVSVDGTLITDWRTIVDGDIEVNTTTGRLQGELQMGGKGGKMRFFGNAFFNSQMVDDSLKAVLVDAVMGGDGDDSIEIDLDDVANTLKTNGIIDLGEGTDTIDIRRGTFIVDHHVTAEHTILGAGGAAVLNIEAGTYDGGIFGAPNDNPKTVSITGGTVTGDIDLIQGEGNTVLIDASGNAAVEGGLFGGSGTDTLEIKGETYKTRSSITGFETIDLKEGSLTVARGHTVTGVDADLFLEADRTLVAEGDITGSGELTLNGTLDIAPGARVTMRGLSSAAGPDSVYGVHLDAEKNEAGELVLTDGGADLSASTISVNIDTGSYIDDGTTYTIVDGDAASIAPAVEVEEDYYVYDFSIITDDDGNDLLLRVERLHTLDSMEGNPMNASIGSVLENIGSYATGDFATVQKNLNMMSGADEIDQAMESLMPESNGLAHAGMLQQHSAMNTVGTRMMAYREGAAKGIWGQSFSGFLEQDMKDNMDGFEADTIGATVGMDSEALVGMALSYAAGGLESDAENRAETDIDSIIVTGYADKAMGDFFLEAMISASYNMYKTERKVAVGDFIREVKSDYTGLQLAGSVALGYTLELFADIVSTPRVGVRYTYLNVDGYKEEGADGAGLKVEPDPFKSLVLSVGTSTSCELALGDALTLYPELRVGYSYDVTGEAFTTKNTFIGGGDSFTLEGMEVDPGAFNLGGGMAIMNNFSGLEFRVDYDSWIRSGYTSHRGQAMFRYDY